MRITARITANLNVRITPAIREAIGAYAERLGVSLNHATERLLIAALVAEGEMEREEARR